MEQAERVGTAARSSLTLVTIETRTMPRPGTSRGQQALLLPLLLCFRAHVAQKSMWKNKWPCRVRPRVAIARILVRCPCTLSLHLNKMINHRSLHDSAPSPTNLGR